MRFDPLSGHEHLRGGFARYLFAVSQGLCYNWSQCYLGCHRFIYTRAKMAYTQLNPRHTPNARVEEISRDSAHYRLSIPSGFSDSYRLAQLDDYAHLSRGRFPHRASTSLSLSARTSSDSIAGTWGFGLWNDPFGLSLGFGGNPFRLPLLPNAIWFFSASKQNYLSFREDKPAQGFLAQTFRSPKFHPWLILAGLVFPFSRKWARRLLGKVII